MTTEWALLSTAAFLGFFHTLVGPDHYIPFVAIGKAKSWSLKKTLGLTSVCGIGHVLGSILIGLVGLLFGVSVEKLSSIEGFRGDTTAWLLLSFGLILLIRGIWKGLRGQTHSHAHVHEDGTIHTHTHDHNLEHAHAHEEKSLFSKWGLFIIFVFGPCEVLIPLLFYPAAESSYGLALFVALIFSLATIATMLVMVTAGFYGLRTIRQEFLHRYSEAVAGLSICLCATAIFIGL